MKLAVACDHRGFEAKRRLLPVLKQQGHEITDFGCESTAACDYPDFAAPAARAVADGNAEIAILMDGSGIGMSVAANKVHNVRAALVHDEVTARRAANTTTATSCASAPTCSAKKPSARSPRSSSPPPSATAATSDACKR